MKRFKTAAAAVAIMVTSAAIFARGAYSGDAQLQLGWQGASTDVPAVVTTTGPSASYPYYPYSSVRTTTSATRVAIPTGAFYAAAQNYNLWGINDRFSVGFFEKVDFGSGSGNSVGSVSGPATRGWFNFIIGPALGFTFNDIVKFQMGLGLALGSETAGGAGATQSNPASSTSSSVPETTTIAASGTGGVAGFALDAQLKFLPHAWVSPLAGMQYALRGGGNATANSFALYVGGSFNFGVR